MPKNYKPGSKQYELLKAQSRLLDEVANILRCNTSDVIERARSLVHDVRRLKQEISEIEKGQSASVDATKLYTVGKTSLMTRIVEGLNPKDLRSLVDEGKNQIGSGVVVIIGKIESGKASLVVGVTDDLTDKITAVELVKVGSKALGGKGGGGRPDMAQAGGPDSGKAVEAIESIQAAIAELKSK